MRARCLVLATLIALVAVAAPVPAAAFCGFYVGGADAKLFNDATLVVLMREGTRTVLSMQNNYQGPPSGFAMVVPVPVVLQEENVKTLPHEVFALVDQLAAPRLVEYWEQDPCWREPRERRRYKSGRVYEMSAVPSMPPNELGVTIEAKFAVGEYEVVVLGAEDSMGLDTWLRRERYAIPEGAEPLLRPYVAEGMKFFVAKVDPTKVRFDGQGRAMLSPLRFHYDSKEFRLPVRLGMINSAGTQDLLVHILAKGQRYEVANYGNVTIPTNIDLDEEAKGRFGEFYAALFDATVARNPGAVVTEYAWDASTCDPCPGPALGPSELASLGEDVLGGQQEAEAPGWMGGGGGGFVLTRLHYRYAKGGLGEDLIFREAPPIVGGREVMMGTSVEKGSRADAYNNFQGRYVIRHRWTGPVRCLNPVWGRWGGPPGGGSSILAARDLASAPRGSIALPMVVREDVPEIGVVSTAPPKIAERSGCRCAATSEGAGLGLALLSLVGLGAGLRRRRRRR